VVLFPRPVSIGRSQGVSEEGTAKGSSTIQAIKDLNDDGVVGVE
jgi:hypothetical protein